MLTKKELKKLALDDLKRSGLSETDFKKMKLFVCDEDEAEAVLNSSFSVSGYVLPYFDSNGKQLESIRFKFLEDLKNEKNKTVKYSQPKGTPPRLYFAPYIKWKDILKDSSITITFTEGEKKAYTACKKGIPTIGLSGVWSFKSKKQQKNLIDDFKQIILLKRKVLICYDNDMHTNNDVLKACRYFANELDEKGADVFNKILPFDPYEKIGIDDYLLTHSKKDFDNLEEKKFNSLIELDMLNNEIAFLQNINKVYIIESESFVSDNVLTKMTYANRRMMDDSGDKDISVAQKWLQWGNRRTHKKLTYLPAQPQITKDNEFNLWKGWGVSPSKGSIKLFTSAVNQLFDNDKILIKWFMDWVAYPIQHPGTKMLSAVLLQSIQQGTGKSSIGLCIGDMYGENSVVIDDSQLSAQFNNWSVNRQFVLGDEVSGKDKRAESDRIKNLITRVKIPIRKMRTDVYYMPDCINYFFTSNHPDPLNIEPTDRRLFVYEVLYGNGLTLEQGQKLEDFRNGKGTAALLHYFINEHKISKGFDHRAKPPMTKAKEELIDHSLTDVERFLSSIKEMPDQMLTIEGAKIDRDLFSTQQVIHLYERFNKNSHVTSTAMGKALKKIFNESSIKCVRGNYGVQRIRPLRNITKWNKADNNAALKHYNKSKIAMFYAVKRKKHEGE